MQAIAIAIAISAIVGGAVGAGATALSFSYSAASPRCPAAVSDAGKRATDYRPVPTTGSKGF